MARGSQATQPARLRGRQAPGGGRGARGGALAQRLRSSAPSRYLIAHPNVSAGLLLGLLVLAYLWPVLLGGRVLTSTGTLYGFAPWRNFAPPDLGSYSNTLLSDIPMADYPWRFLVRQMLHEGTFPSWNPFIFGGIPLYSNPQTGLFSLFSLPLWILPLNYGIGAGAALKLWAAGFGSYLLVRQLRLGFLPGLLAGACFSFSAINITWLTHETIPAVAALLPWMLWLVERIYQGGGGWAGSVAGLAVATAIGLGGGHPGMQVHLMAAVGVYALLRAAFMPREAAVGERLRPLALAVGGLALGALLMAFMLLPEALSTRGTIGTAARSHGSGTLPGTQMPFTAIRTVLFPDWWGRPSSVELNGPITELAPGVAVPLNYNERTFYAGTVALLLALVGVAAGSGWRRRGPFVVLAVLGLAIPLHTPGLYALVTHLPAFELVQNQRLHFVWAMGLAVLAAFGLQALLERPAADRRRLGVAVGGLVLAGVVFAIAAIGAGTGALSDTLEHFASGMRARSPDVLQLTSAVWYLLLAVGVVVAVLAAWRWPERRAWIAVGVVLLAAFDMLHFATGYQPMMPKASLPPETPAIAYLQRHRDDGRIMGVNLALTNDFSLTYGLRDVRGYDPPQPSERLFRLWSVAEPGQLDWTAFSMASLNSPALQVASVLGARYVLTEPGVQKAEQREASSYGLRVVYDGDDALIFENERAVPRAMAAPVVRVVPDEREARALLAEPLFDSRRAVVVEQAEQDAAALGAVIPAGRSPAGRVSVSDPSNARVLMRATLPHRGLVVLNDGWAPGWSVRVDGRDADPVRVNDVMRGVVVPAGAHSVEWSYRVPGLRAGIVVSLIALAGLGALLVVGRRVSRRELE